MAQSSRTINPGDAQDERLARVPLTAAYSYAYLPLVLDDEGRAKDQPSVFNGHLWPLRADEHPTDAMVADIDALVEAGVLCRYSAGGGQYVHDPAWRSRQRVVRPVRSTLPRCPVHESGLRDLVGDTLSSVSEQVSTFIGDAASSVGQARVRDRVARLVEDVTFPVDPDKAAAYGQRVREFLGGATAGPAQQPPSVTVVVEPADDEAPADDAHVADRPADEVRDDDADAGRGPAADVWREVTDDPLDGEDEGRKP